MASNHPAKSKNSIPDWISLILMNVILILATVLFTQLKLVDHLREYRIERISGNTEQRIYGDRKISQTTCCEKADSFELQISAAYSNYHGSFQVVLYDSENIIVESWRTDKLDLVSDRQGKNGWVYYHTNNREFSAGKQYRIEVTAPELDEGSAIILKTISFNNQTTSNGNCIDSCEINGEESDQVLSFSVYQRHPNVFFSIAVLILFALANIWWFNRDKQIEKLAPMILIGAGLIMLLIFAPGSQPDEIYHYDSAMKLSNIILGESENINQAPSTLEQKNQHYNRNDTFVKLLSSPIIENQNDESKYYLTRADDLHHPFVYFAQALGISLGRLLNLSQVYLYELARLFTMMAYISMALIAIRLIPFHKETMLLICIIPMSMHLATSLSRDNIVNGMSFIYFAYNLKIIEEKRRFTWMMVLINILMLIVLGPVKVIYCVFALLVIMIPANQFKSRWDRILKIALIPLCTLVYLLMTEKSSLNYNLTASSWAGQTDYYHLSFLFEHPFRFARLILGTMGTNAWDFLNQMIGSKMAGLNVYISDYLIVGYMVILVLSSFDKGEQEKSRAELETKQRWVLFLTVILGYALLVSAFAFANTLYGKTSVLGLQGRYLIPFAPLLVFVLNGKGIKIRLEKKQLWYAVWVIELGCIVDVMSQVVI